MNDEPSSGAEYDKLIKPIMITAKIISIWPLAEDSSKRAILLRRFHLFCMFFLVMMSVAVTADVVHNIDNLDEATECALICTAFYLCVVRLLVYSSHQEDMLYVVNTMRKDWVSSSHEDRAILEERTMFAFRLVKYFISTVAVTIVLFMFVPILEIYVLGSNEKMLPFRGYFFINHTASPVFECFYLFNVTAGGFGGSMIAGATGFNLVVIMHGSGKFAVLRRRLEELNGEDPNSTAVMSNYMMEDKGRLMKYSTFLNSAILELFMFSFSGNGLMDEVMSEGVGDSAYGSGWIGSDFCQTLQIMMMRARIPSKITAAKFYAMSLESFSAEQIIQLQQEQALDDSAYLSTLQGRIRQGMECPQEFGQNVTSSAEFSHSGWGKLSAYGLGSDWWPADADYCRPRDGNMANIKVAVRVRPISASWLRDCCDLLLPLSPFPLVSCISRNRQKRRETKQQVVGASSLRVSLSKSQSEWNRHWQVQTSGSSSIKRRLKRTLERRESSELLRRYKAKSRDYYSDYRVVTASIANSSESDEETWLARTPPASHDEFSQGARISFTICPYPPREVRRRREKRPTIPQIRVSNTRLAQAASGCAPSVDVLPIFDVKQQSVRNPARMGGPTSLSVTQIAIESERTRTWDSPLARPENFQAHRNENYRARAISFEAKGNNLALHIRRKVKRIIEKVSQLFPRFKQKMRGSPTEDEDERGGGGFRISGEHIRLGFKRGNSIRADLEEEKILPVMSDTIIHEKLYTNESYRVERKTHTDATTDDKSNVNET
ncbi:hypothetical protein WN51_04834 [Melipona quadrifasciata]|uniref:Odorant receptor 13a n=1 Tax=Melipona quadrifasciata TaxID=166423 RepID=A0A0N0BDG6_9HYME|nr:hypothetical protein WN51_04834 [Melipona quadrifasciata]